jgi:hypothetical protein
MPQHPVHHVQFISNIPDLLRAIADGGELVMTHDGEARETWHVAKPGKPDRRVLASTARAAKRKGYIVPSGILYWHLTIAGERARERGKT